MKCQMCNREMTNEHADGIGPICAKKMLNGDSAALSWRSKILEYLHNSVLVRVFNENESYLVSLVRGKGRVVGQLALCGCRTLGCEHIDIARNKYGLRPLTEMISEREFKEIVASGRLMGAMRKRDSRNGWFWFDVVSRGHSIVASRRYDLRSERDQAFIQFAKQYRKEMEA